MKLKTLLPILALGIVPAHASIIFIDNFTGDQTVTGGNQSGVTVGSGILGGSRNVKNTASGALDAVDISGNELTFNLFAAHTGTALVTYDGDTDSTLNENGIAPVDLTSGGLNVYIGLSVRSDLVTPITLTFYSGTGNSSTYTFNTPAQGFVQPYTDYLIKMTSFAPATGAGANFSGITAATLFINGSTPGVDVQVRNFTAMPTPEPGTFGLIGAGLVGLAFVRRRKK